MADLETVVRIGAVVALLILLGGVGWILMHLRKIKTTLIADEAMPKSAPATNFLVLITAVLLGLSALLVRFIFYPN